MSEVAAPVADIMLSDASIEDVMVAVCEHFELRMNDLRGKDRRKTVAMARHVAMYLCKHRMRYAPSFPEVGRAFGNRDHTTVMSAVRKIETQRLADPRVEREVSALETTLGCRGPSIAATRYRIAIPEAEVA